MKSLITKIISERSGVYGIIHFIRHKMRPYILQKVGGRGDATVEKEMPTQNQGMLLKEEQT